MSDELSREESLPALAIDPLLQIVEAIQDLTKTLAALVEHVQLQDTFVISDDLPEQSGGFRPF